MDLKFRTLRADEVDVRVATVSEKGCSLLLYKDARVDCNILDETVGRTNWQRSHEVINGNLFCNVGIYDTEKDQWIWKQDVGVESYTEKEKGQASDSFKRACFLWGIGRELYTAPFIWVSSDKVILSKNTNGKYTIKNAYFKVKQIDYDAGKIIKLEITCKQHDGRQWEESSVFTAGLTDLTPAKKESGSIDEPAKKKDVDEWMKEQNLDRPTMLKYICDNVPLDKQKEWKKRYKVDNLAALGNKDLATIYINAGREKVNEPNGRDQGVFTA